MCGVSEDVTKGHETPEIFPYAGQTWDDTAMMNNTQLGESRCVKCLQLTQTGDPIKITRNGEQDEHINCPAFRKDDVEVDLSGTCVQLEPESDMEMERRLQG